MMKAIRSLQCLTLGICLIVLIGCGDAESTGGGGTQQAAEEKVQQLPEIAGTPTDAGYFDGNVMVLRSEDPGSGAPLPLTAKTFPMAIRIEVDKAVTLMPDEYSAVIGKKSYEPLGISFGDKRETFFSLDDFVASEVELKLGGSDQITTNKQGKLNSCSLAAGEVYLLYLVPGSPVVGLEYDGKEYEVQPTNAADLGVESPAVNTASKEGDGDDSKPTGPQGLQLDIARAQLAIGNIDGKDTEVFELELTFKSTKYETVELHLGQDFFLEGNAETANTGSKKRRRGRRSRRLFVELQEEKMRLLAGTEFFDNTYKDKPVKELINGGLAISVEPGLPLTALFVFPNPPFENGLSLRFPGRPPIDVVPAGDVLGEIRPTIPRGVAKIPRAPLVGEPMKVNVIEGNILVDAGGKSLTAQGPGGGNQFVMLTFSIKGERQFVPRDYVLRDAADTNYYPEAATFGNAPAQKIPGDGYEPIDLKPGDEDLVRRRKGELHYWQYATPEVAVIFSLPQSLSTFDFSHGDRMLKITPVTPPKTWKELRPEESLAASNDSKSKAATLPKKKEPATPEEIAAEKAKRADSQLRFGKLLLKKDADKAREYFEEAVRIAPESAAGKEAKELLDGLN